VVDQAGIYGVTLTNPGFAAFEASDDVEIIVKPLAIANGRYMVVVEHEAYRLSLPMVVGR
jgi:hypothetical protein